MSRRRLIVLASTGGVVLLLVLVILLAPVQASNAVKGTYRAMPKGLRDVVPDGAENAVGGGIDNVVRALAGDNPRVLIGLGIELVDSSVPEGGWTGTGRVVLSWTDLNHSEISYEVYTSASKQLPAIPPSATVDVPAAEVAIAANSVEWVIVVPVAGGRRGSVNAFGPFGHDPSPPPVPLLDDPGKPGGYTFTLSWRQVSDVSGISEYQLERETPTGVPQVVASSLETSWFESNIGNGEYTYRVRAVNGGGLVSAWSAPVVVTVTAPMDNPGVGSKDYGIHANYTSFLQLWDLNSSRYLTLAQLEQPPHKAARDGNIGKEWGIETDNATLRAIVDDVVGTETNTFRIAESLFLWLYEELDYDTSKAAGADQQLFTAGQTLDAGGGICGDLAVLYITLLRIAGVPARPLHGYLDNTQGGATVRGEFHMWVEVYVGGDPDNPWMTVDVSGASADDPQKALFLFFGLFNPDYLGLGTETVFDPVDAEKASWNSWARFQWTCQGPCDPDFDAGGITTDLDVTEKFLVVHPATRQRVLADKDDGQTQPAVTDVPVACQDGSCFFWAVHTRVVKQIDYGVDVTRTPSNLIELNIELRYPKTDAFAATNPYQSVVYTVYENGAPVSSPPPAAGFYEFVHG